MLSVGKLTFGAEAYYLKTVAAAQEEYYTGAGEAPGEWLGRGAASLSLQGSVDPGDLHALLGGRSPADGAPIRSQHAARAHIAGFDLTFSAPKSVSLLYGLASPQIADQVRAAHDEAVAAGLSYIESHALCARRGHNGMRVVQARGVIAAAFRHRTSRAGDPQLHTHVLVANAVEGDDGAFSAPDGRLLYHHARAAGYLYQARLRVELAGALGVSFAPVRNGAAEIAGVTDRLLAAFSTRRHEIDSHLAATGGTGARNARIAALATRRHKQPLGLLPTPHPASLRETWRVRAEALGCDPDEPSRLVGPPREIEITAEVREEITADLLGPSGLTAARSAFERRDVVCEVACRLADGAAVHVIDRIVAGIVSSPHVVALGTRGRGAEERLTTHELIDTEAALVRLALSQSSSRLAVVSPAILATVLGSHETVSSEQAAMVRCLTGSGRGVEVVIGAAGTGKTFALLLARKAWEQDGYTVIGAALAARAACELEGSSGIASSTLAALDTAIGTGSDPLGSDTVLVIDEAGMVGTRMLSRVVTAAAGSSTKIVLIGDDRQLPEIDAGGSFGTIARETGAVRLTENRRQVEPWERDALSKLREENVASSLAAYEANGRIRRCASLQDARSALVAGWLDARLASPGTRVVMYACRNVDVDVLNTEARSLMARKGRLGSEIYRAPTGQGFARGEEVIFLRNDRAIGAVNGLRAQVVGRSAGGLVLREAGDKLVVPDSYVAAGHLAYGYASTVHRSQGATVDTAFVLGTGTLYREAAYVAMSRAREASFLYAVPDDLAVTVPAGLGEEGAHARRETSARSLVETVSVSRAKSTAIDEAARAHLLASLQANPDTIEPVAAMSPVSHLDHDRARSPAKSNGLCL